MRDLVDEFVKNSRSKQVMKKQEVSDVSSRKKGEEAREKATASSYLLDDEVLHIPDYFQEVIIEAGNGNGQPCEEESLADDQTAEQPLASTSRKILHPVRNRKFRSSVQNAGLDYLKERFEHEKKSDERKLALEERKLLLEERRLKLEEDKFNLEKRERERFLEISASHQNTISFLINKLNNN